MTDLRALLAHVEDRAPDLLVGVTRDVDPQWELSAVQMRLQAEDKLPFLLFERVAAPR